VTAKTATDAGIRIVSREKNRKGANMFRKLLSLALAGLLLHTASIQPAFAQSKAGNQAQLVEKVKAQILHLGVGEASRVTVRLRNNAKMEGYISKTGEDSFEVTNKKTGDATTIAYDDVAQVKRKGLSTGAKVGIGVAIGAAVTVTALYINFKKNGLGGLRIP
jgi:hypothetical protein